MNGVKFTRTVAIVDDIPYIFNIGYLLAVYPIGDKVIFHTESQGIFSFDKLTKELIKIVPNTRRSFVVSTHDKVFFTYYTLNKYQLWVTDGTFEGSKIIDPLISHVGQGFNVAYDGKETIFILAILENWNCGPPISIQALKINCWILMEQIQRILGFKLQF